MSSKFNFQATADRVENNEWFEYGIRAGLAAYGVVHLMIAWLALQLVFGHQSTRAASQQGAMHVLASQEFGTPLLWLIGAGFVTLAMWQIVEAAFGHTRQEGATRVFTRVGSAGRAAVYLALAWSAVQTAVGSGSSTKKDKLTAQLMSEPLGRVLVGLVGVVIIGIGGYLISKAWRRSFESDLSSKATSGRSGSVVVRLGQIGYTAKGASIVVIGSLFATAALTYDAKKAGGLDVALHTLLQQPFGRWLMGLVAIGIGCFGLYCFVWARHADTSS